MKNMVYRGEVYYADLSPVIGSEQGGIRPVIILQNNVGNKYAPTTIVAPITSCFTKKPLPTHIILDKTACGLPSDSIVLLEQIKTIDKRRLKSRMGIIEGVKWEEINKALAISVGLA
jgi:mRNA interferase MazF